MKYTLFSALLMGSLFGLSSCSLGYDPVDSYSDVTEGVESTTEETVVFKDKAAVESHMKNLNRILHERQEHWYVDVLLIAECHADNAYAGTTGAEVVPYETNAIEGSNSVLKRDWDRFLADIAVCNKLICGIDATPDNSLSAAERSRYKSQAKLLRSMIWFDMVRLWGNIPLITTVAGDITAETVGDVYQEYFPEQSDEASVYKQIETDLLDVMNDANLENDSPDDKSVLSKSVARALLAKLYAEKPIQDYDKVKKYCDELAATGYDLVDNYGDLFGYDTETKTVIRNTKESIYEAHYDAGGGNWCTWMFGRNLNNWDESFTWAKWITPSRDLISAFDAEGDAVRKNESLVYYACDWSNYYPKDQYPFMYKCRSSLNSIIKMRYADILLLKAEACILGATPDLETAAAILDKVRARVGLKALSATDRGNKDNLLKAYLKERRLELAFEGQRWYDLVRLNKVEEVMNAVYAKDSGRKAQVNLFNANSYLMAIPQGAIDQNDNLTQNPGY